MRPEGLFLCKKKIPAAQAMGKEENNTKELTNNAAYHYALLFVLTIFYHINR